MPTDSSTVSASPHKKVPVKTRPVRKYDEKEKQRLVGRVAESFKREYRLHGCMIICLFL